MDTITRIKVNISTIEDHKKNIDSLTRMLEFASDGYFLFIRSLRDQTLTANYETIGTELQKLCTSFIAQEIERRKNSIELLERHLKKIILENETTS